MWINIGDIYIDSINIDDIIKLTIDKRNRMRIITNEQYHSNIYISDPSTCIILNHYMHTKNQKNRLIDIRNENYHNSIYINTNKVSEYIATPIFNTICNYIIYTINSINHCKLPMIDKLHFLPNIIINKKLFNKKLNDKFNVKLFDYQKRTIMRMMEIEKGNNIDFDANYNIQLGEHNIFWDPYNEVITDSETKCIVRSKGGILADTMGLGKTIMMLGICVTNMMTKTLIVLPFGLLEQWWVQIYKTTGHKAIIYHGNKKKNIKTRW